MVNYFSIYLGMTIIYHTFTCLNASQRRVNELEAVFSGPRAEVWRKVVNLIGEISEKPGFIWIYMDLYGFIWIYMDLYGFNNQNTNGDLFS